MSEPLAERLSRFTPDASGLDRDALLFAVGRASARPNRRWIALAGALAACQLLTLVSLWPHTPPSSSVNPVIVSETAPIISSADSPIVHDPSEFGALRERLLASEGDWPTAADDGPMVAPTPPLRAFGLPPSTILN
jgi:hypothetical protein